MTSLIDFHCHVDLYPDPPEVIAECDRLGVRTLAVTTTPMAWPQNRKWTERSSYVRPALGLHPQLAAEREHEISLFEQYFAEARYIGEVGLDAGPQHYRSLDAQMRVFRRVLELCASNPKKIVSVHSVRATSKVLDTIEEILPFNHCSFVLHWFSGTKGEAQRAAALGCYFSINRAMLDGRRPELVRSLPIDRLLTETDGPFTSNGTRPARPADIPETVSALAFIINQPVPKIMAQLASNLRALVVNDE